VSAEAALRGELVATMRAMETRGLNRGTSGNVSARWGEGMLVTPTGIVPDALTPESIVYVDANGDATGDYRPSSEWRMHAGIYDHRADARAVVHCHARHATILACAGREIPPMHYMVLVSGGPSVRVAPYATFGSDALARGVVATLDGRRACLMANHGLIALGASPRQALAITEEVEEQAAVYLGTLAIGGPILLSDAQMADVAAAFQSYGQTHKQ
jgi:L-fuculose-phosphate aldolase